MSRIARGRLARGDISNGRHVSGGASVSLNFGTAPVLGSNARNRPWAVLPGQGEPRPGPTAPVLSRRTNQPEIPPTAAFDLSNQAAVRRSVGAWGDRARLYLLRAMGSDIDQVFAHKQRESGAGERQVVSQFEM